MFRKYYIVSYTWQDKNDNSHGSGTATVNTPRNGFINVNDFSLELFPADKNINVCIVAINKVKRYEWELYAESVTAQSKRLNDKEKPDPEVELEQILEL
jgi:hypothetical protein